MQTFLSLPFLAPQHDVGQILSLDSNVCAWVVAISRVDHAVVELCALSSLVFPPTHQWQRLSLSGTTPLLSRGTCRGHTLASLSPGAAPI